MTPSPEPFEIWLVRFLFLDDPSRSKVCPAVCLSYDDRRLRAVMAKVTSHAPRLDSPGELALLDWESAGLLKPSCVRCSQAIDIPDSSIYRRMGMLSNKDKLALVETLKSIGAI